MSKNSTVSGRGDIKKVYLYKGNVDSRRQTAVDKLVASAVDPDTAAFDLEKFDGNNSNAESILAAVTIAPMGNGRKTVIVDRVGRLEADDQERIARFAAKLPDRSCLILLAEEEDARGKSSSSRKQSDSSEEGSEGKGKKQKKGLRPELTSAVKKHGEVVEFGKLKEDGLRAIVREAVRSQGKKIEPSAAGTLISAMSATPALIEQEVAKLAAYVGERESITADDVEKVVSKSPEDLVFRLINAIATKQPAQAIRFLNETYDAGAKPDSDTLRILALMARHFRLLYQTKFLTTQGRTWKLDSVPEELRAMLMDELSPLAMPPWQRSSLLEQTRLFSFEELEGCLRQVLLCELASKGLGSDAGSSRLSMEMLVLRLSQRN